MRWTPTVYDEPGRMFIPEFTEAQKADLQLEVLKLCHDSPVAGHPGYKKTIELVTCSYWWSGVTNYVKDYVS